MMNEFERDLNKVCTVILSCKTASQLDTAYSYYELFEKKWGRSRGGMLSVIIMPLYTGKRVEIGFG